jgi:hypothetical protein
MSKVSTAVMALAVVLLPASGPEAAEPEKEAVRKSGILGTWAVDCSKPSSASNPYQAYAIDKPHPTRTLAMATESLDGVFDMRKARLLGNNRLAYTDVKRGRPGKHFDVVVEIAGGRLRSLSSVADDGTVIIRDGKFVKSGAPTLVFQRCASR